MKRCPHCGQLLAPELAVDERRLPHRLRVRGTVKQLIYAAVRERPRTAKELYQLLWANDPDASAQRLYIHIHHLNHLLQRHGLAVRLVASHQNGCDTREYHLVTLDAR